MRNLLTRAQFGLMRLIGMRKLREALEARAEVAQADMRSRVEVLQSALTERDQTANERLDLLNRQVQALGEQLSRQGQSDTERGDTIQIMLRDLQTRLEKMHDQSNRERGASHFLGELRAEISGMRADYAREAELMMEQFEKKISAGHS